jgi:CelD/BcsL family acetyltransferase involved in cellulose biosynthesis
MEGATFEEYLAKFSSKSRATLRAKARKFPDWRSYSSPDEMADFHRIARAISERTYQEKLHDAGLPASAAFLDEARRLAAEDRVRAYLLFHEGRAVAYLYCPVHDGVLVYEYLGYDPEFAKLSPGTALQYLALEKLFAEGRYRLFDFTQGEGSHKEYFSNGSVFCADIYWFPATLGNRLRVRAHHGLDRFSGRVVALLDRMGLKERVKRWLRRA